MSAARSPGSQRAKRFDSDWDQCLEKRGQDSLTPIFVPGISYCKSSLAGGDGRGANHGGQPNPGIQGRQTAQGAVEGRKRGRTLAGMDGTSGESRDLSSARGLDTAHPQPSFPDFCSPDDPSLPSRDKIHWQRLISDTAAEQRLCSPRGFSER